MSKNLILIFILMAVAIIITQQFFFKNTTPPAGEKQGQAQQQQQATPSQTATPATAAPVAPPPPAAAGAKQAASESETVVENDLYRIVFTNKGALVKSWVLKKFEDSNGKPLELVHQQAAPLYGYPLSLYTNDEALRTKLNSALYVTDAGATLSIPGTLNYEYSDGDITVHKKLTFDDSYVIGIETSVTRGGSYLTALPAWPSGFGDETIPGTYAAQRIDYSNGTDIKRLSADRKGKDISGVA